MGQREDGAQGDQCKLRLEDDPRQSAAARAGHTDAENNFSAPMQRIRFYLRAASDAAPSGDLPAAILAAELAGEFVKRDLVPAFKSEAQRRERLEERAK